MSDLDELWEIIAELCDRIEALEHAVYDEHDRAPAIVNVPGPDTYDP